MVGVLYTLAEIEDRMTPERWNIIRIEDRQTGEMRYILDYGQLQLLGPWYETRAEAEAALAEAARRPRST